MEQYDMNNYPKWLTIQLGLNKTNIILERCFGAPSPKAADTSSGNKSHCGRARDKTEPVSRFASSVRMITDDESLLLCELRVSESARHQVSPKLTTICLLRFPFMAENSAEWSNRYIVEELKMLLAE